MKNIIVFNLVVLIFSSTNLYSGENGRICIAPLPIELREANIAPWEIVDEKGNTDFYVTLNDRKPIQTSIKESRWIENIDLDKKHVVIISKGAQSKERFTFGMNNYEFRNKNKKDLCLFVNDLYLTWQLYKVEQTGSWCPCWSSEGKN